MEHAAELACRMGRIGRDVVTRQSALLDALHLPRSLPAGVKLSPDEVLATMKLDKKSRGGQMRFVLPSRIGHVELVNVPEPPVQQLLNELLQ